jgi:hypothetical protein
MPEFVVILLALAGYLALSVAVAMMYVYLAGQLQQRRTAERGMALAAEDQTPDRPLPALPDGCEWPACTCSAEACEGPLGPVETYGQERLYAPQCRAAHPFGMADWVCTLPPHSSTTMHGDGPIRWNADGDVYAATEATS